MTLRTAQALSVQRTPQAASLQVYNPAVDSGRNNLLEALKQVERRTENGASGWRLLLYALILAPASASVIGYLLTLGPQNYTDEHYFEPLLYLGLAVSLLLLLSSLIFASEVRRKIRKRLASGDLLVYLLSLSDDPIFTHTPWPWRLTLPGSIKVDQSYQVLLHRVAWNLDWYLGRPKRLWRLQWLTTPLIFLTLFIYLGLVIPSCVERLMTGGFSELGDSWIDFLVYDWLPLLLLVPIVLLKHRRQIWTEELVRHLRERLEA